MRRATDNITLAEQRRRAEFVADRAVRREAIIDRGAIVAPFAVIAVLATVLVPGFLSVANLQSVPVNASIVAIVGFGMTLVIVILSRSARSRR